MNNKHNSLILFSLFCIGCLPVFLGSAALAQTRQKSMTEYSIIGTRNLFKNKETALIPEGKPSAAQTQEGEQNETKQPLETEGLILTGVVLTGDSWRIIIEDNKTGEGLFLSKGDSVRSMNVLEVSEEKVILDNQGKKVELVMERNPEQSAEPLSAASARPKAASPSKRTLLPPASQYGSQQNTRLPQSRGNINRTRNRTMAPAPVTKQNIPGMPFMPVPDINDNFDLPVPEER